MLRHFIPGLKISKHCSLPHFINGRFVKPNGCKIDRIINPADNTSIGNIILDDTVACFDAINSSKKAFIDWSKTSINHRMEKLINWNNWIVDNKASIATVVSSENGKTISDATAEIDRGIEVVRYALSAPTLLKGDYSIINDNLEIHTKKQPLGVTTGIMPFNFPAMIPLWMIPISIVCGNSIIIKSSEKCPLTPLYLAYGATQSGVPDGVINIVHGDAAISSKLITHPDVPAVSFVGSTSAGKKIYDLASKHGKRTQINMGAKNHATVMPDCDFDDTSSAIVSAFVMGQRCMAISVVLVVDGAESIINNIIRKLGNINPVRDMGSLITRESKEKVIVHIENSIMCGAHVIYGDIHKDINNDKGNYMEPIIIDNVDTEMEVYKNELFAPVLSIIRVSNISQAIEIINNNEYGNGTSIFTTSAYSANKYENEVNVTQCGINVPIPVSPPYYSWTSAKESYRGSHYVYGPSSFEFYTQQKTIMNKYKVNNKISVAMPTN